MKFISKFSNYRVVLKPGIPGNRNTGVQAIPGLYVKFEDGIAEVTGDDHIKAMMEHPSFGEGCDFITAAEDGKDPFYAERKDSEPAHSITEIKYGSVGKSVGGRPPVKFSEMQKKAIKSMAADLASNLVVELLPKAVENELKKRDAKIGEENTPKAISSVEIGNNQINPLNEKIMAPAPIEDEEVLEDKPLEVKEISKIGGIENAEVVTPEVTAPKVVTPKVVTPKVVTPKTTVKNTTANKTTAK